MDQRVRVHVPHEVHVGVPQQLVADEVAHGVVFFVEGEGARVRLDDRPVEGALGRRVVGRCPEGARAVGVAEVVRVARVRLRRRHREAPARLALTLKVEVRDEGREAVIAHDLFAIGADGRRLGDHAPAA